MSISDNTVIIGIGHKSRHGKDTVANTIVKEFSKLYDVRKYGFGVQLKQEVNELDQFATCFTNGILYDTHPDMSDPYCNTVHGKQSNLLQYWGAERRKQDKFYWVKKLDSIIKKEKPQFAIVSDLRHLNEMMWTKSNKGYTIKVTRTGFVDLSRDPNHISETELDNVMFDYDITTIEGEVSQLKKDAIEVFNMIVAELTPRVDSIEELNNVAV